MRSMRTRHGGDNDEVGEILIRKRLRRRYGGSTDDVSDDLVFAGGAGGGAR